MKNQGKDVDQAVKLPPVKWIISNHDDILNFDDPIEAINSGKVMAKAWAKKLCDSEHIPLVQNFILIVVETYWDQIHTEFGKSRALPAPFIRIVRKKLDKSATVVAEAIGVAASSLSVTDAGYLLGNLYTTILPENMRTAGGMYYTPPALTNRLIGKAQEHGINWSNARIIDPACGGGAFLAPVALKIEEALKRKKKTPDEIVLHLRSNLTGWEVDPFGGWLTQVFVEAALRDSLSKSALKLGPLVRICDSLDQMSELEASFDLVIGNPPYGKIKLTDKIRTKFAPSLYGHPNLYGLFTHLALHLTASNGIVAYLTPTSFLSGEYFKNLRNLIRVSATPIELDFVSFRKGVFDDVLQETMLAVYTKRPYRGQKVKINQITTASLNALIAKDSGAFALNAPPSAPWIFPKMPTQSAYVNAMENMPCKLKDWGYRISTGPLVWNRHKHQLGTARKNDGYYPVIWAECITPDGRFMLKADKKNHSPFFRFQQGDEWLVTKKPCILLQRTTAKEQDKRLIAAALPDELLKKGVVVENHLNMIIATDNTKGVNPEILSVFLNSRAVNEAFRTISGSVAVSAYELESMPLPKASRLETLNRLVKDRADRLLIEEECERIYKLI